MLTTARSRTVESLKRCWRNSSSHRITISGVCRTSWPTFRPVPLRQLAVPSRAVLVQVASIVRACDVFRQVLRPSRRLSSGRPTANEVDRGPQASLFRRVMPPQACPEADPIGSPHRLDTARKVRGGPVQTARLETPKRLPRHPPYPDWRENAIRWLP